MTTTPTDLDALETAFAAAISGITPTHTRDQNDGWEHVAPALGVQSGAARKTRAYHFEWGDEVEAEEGDLGIFGMGAYTLVTILSVVTKYNFRDDVGDKIWNSDHRQLRDVLQDLTSSTDGLWNVESAGAPDVEVDESGHAPKVTHAFRVVYFKDRT